MASVQGSLTDDDQLLVDNAAFETSVQPPVYLQAAYEMFFCAQMILGCRLWLLRRDSFALRQYSTFNCIFVFSLGIVYFIARKQPLSTEVGRGLVALFLFHNLTLLIVTMYRQVKGINDDISSDRRFQTAAGVLYMIWVICGTMAIRKLQTYKILL